MSQYNKTLYRDIFLSTRLWCVQNLVIKSSKSIQKASEKQLNNEDVRNLQPNLKVSRERLGLLENTFLCYSLFGELGSLWHWHWHWCSIALKTRQLSSVWRFIGRNTFYTQRTLSILGKMLRVLMMVSLGITAQYIYVWYMRIGISLILCCPNRSCWWCAWTKTILTQPSATFIWIAE